jgi:hypothetical protein
MTDLTWRHLTAASSVAGKVKELDEAIQGGVVTDMLEELAGVLTDSALHHLRQALVSNDPLTRLRQAADGFQGAYFAQQRAADRGAGRMLRMVTRPVKLRRSFMLAGGCAAWVAVLQHRVGEAPQNVREWVDNVGFQIGEEWRAVTARDRLAANPILGEVVSARMAEPLPATHWANVVGAYHALEARVLPPELIAPRPWAWRTVGELQTHFGADYSRLNAEGFFEREESILPLSARARGHR